MLTTRKYYSDNPIKHSNLIRVFAVETRTSLLKLSHQRRPARIEKGRRGGAGCPAGLHSGRLVVAAAVQPEVDEEVCHQRNLQPAAGFRLLAGVHLELVEPGLGGRIDEKDDLFGSFAFHDEG